MIEILSHYGFVIAALLTLLASVVAHRKWKRDVEADNLFRIERERHESRQKTEY